MTLSPLSEQINEPKVRRTYSAFLLNLFLFLVIAIYLTLSVIAQYSVRHISFFQPTQFIFWLLAASGALLVVAVWVLEPLLKRIRAHSLAIILLMLTLIAGTTYASKSWVMKQIQNTVAALPARQQSDMLALNKALVMKNPDQLAAIFKVSADDLSTGEAMALKVLQPAAGIKASVPTTPVKLDRFQAPQVLATIYSAGLILIIGSVLFLLNGMGLVLTFGRMMAALMPQRERTVRLASVAVSLVATVALFSTILMTNSTLTASNHYQQFASTLTALQGEDASRLVTFAVHAQGVMSPLLEQAAEKLKM